MPPAGVCVCACVRIDELFFVGILKERRQPHGGVLLSRRCPGRRLHSGGPGSSSSRAAPRFRPRAGTRRGPPAASAWGAKMARWPAGHPCAGQRAVRAGLRQRRASGQTSDRWVCSRPPRGWSVVCGGALPALCARGYEPRATPRAEARICVRALCHTQTWQNHRAPYF